MRGMRFAFGFVYPLASFSLKKSLTKRRLCEAYEKPQWKGLLEKSGLAQWKDEAFSTHFTKL
jgi:hypothetical protein